MTHITHAARFGRVAAATALALSAMSPAWAEEPAKSFADMMRALPQMPASTHDSEMLDRASAAIDYIRRMDLPRAHQAINEALQLDARNSYLHFLNGFVYHLQAKQGDTEKGGLAIEGYQQALRIDPSNWIAQEFLGLAFMDLKQFAQAKTQFSQALLLTPDSSVSIHGLMVSAYLTGDAATACAMADQYRKLPGQPPMGFIRSSVSVYAACGRFDRADTMRTLLGQAGDAAPDMDRVDKRLAQWKAFYLKSSVKSEPADDAPQRFAQAFSVPSLGSPPAVAPSAAAADSTTPASTPTPTPGAAPAASATIGGPRMLLIDVVLLSTQELATTSKGVNLLDALTLQLGSSTKPAYSREFGGTTNIDATGASATTSSTTITRAVTIPALSYSLNIANANNSTNEVLARPTLAAIEGMPSEFFSGTNLSAGLVSTSQQGGTTIVPLDKRFGIKLAVTPTFLPQGQVQLKVDAQRTALNATIDNPKAAYQIEIGETTANANVVMNVGETLVLSGLSEKSSSTVRDGVPGLQDIPVVQYLFSNEKTNEIKRSVLILVTPRAATPVVDADPKSDHTMAALREKFALPASLPSNLEAIMNQLKPDEFFREFRQGDVAMERWDRMRSTGDRLKEALTFLYY
jgi:tetratricopeptide (TPR) repeat protein